MLKEYRPSRGVLLLLAAPISTRGRWQETAGWTPRRFCARAAHGVLRPWQWVRVKDKPPAG